jgi:LPS export ABC transporter protein LptC
MKALTQNKLTSFAIIVILAGFLLISESERDNSNSGDTSLTSDRPDIFVDNAQFTFYDSNGIASKLNSEQTLFYSDQDQVSITNPSASYTSPEGEVIELNAKTGNYDQSQKILTLQGDVTIKQVFPKNKIWSIQSSEFIIDKELGLITSRHDVILKRNESMYQATGLKGNLHNKRIELLSNVRGHYAFDN